MYDLITSPTGMLFTLIIAIAVVLALLNLHWDYSLAKAQSKLSRQGHVAGARGRVYLIESVVQEFDSNIETLLSLQNGVLSRRGHTIYFTEDGDLCRIFLGPMDIVIVADRLEVYETSRTNSACVLVPNKIHDTVNLSNCEMTGLIRMRLRDGFLNVSLVGHGSLTALCKLMGDRCVLDGDGPWLNATLPQSL